MKKEKETVEVKVLEGDSVFSLEKNFEFYAEKSGLNAEDIDPIQYEETRKSFYAGMISMFTTMTHDLSKIEEKDKAMEHVKSMSEEVIEYVTEQMAKIK